MDYSVEVKFWAVWNPSNGSPTMRYDREEDARSEAERLANKFQGQKFYVLKAVFVSAVERPAITKRLSDGIPF